MAYVGNTPSRGQWRKLSDISASFNGVTTTFTTSVPPGTSDYYVTAGTASQLIISVGGVIQEPDVDYTVSTNSITFTTAPAAGLSFFGVLCGDALNTTMIADGSVTTQKLAADLTVDLASGTAGAPSLTFDANTGLFSPAGDIVAISTNGSERTRVDSSGRFLVGTSSVGGYRVSATSYNPQVEVKGTFSSPSWGGSLAIVSTNQAGNLWLVNDTTNPASGDNLGVISFNGYDGTNRNQGASIAAQVDATTGTGDLPSRLVFSTTADGASSPTERLRIAQNGVTTIQNGAVAVIGTLTDAATITPDLAANCNFVVTLGGNRTIANPTNITAGQSGSIFIVQDATGSRTLSWGSFWDFPGGTAPTLSTAANAVDRVDYIVRSATSIHTVFTANYS